MEGSSRETPWESWPCLWFCYSRSVTSASPIYWSASRGKAQRRWR